MKLDIGGDAAFTLILIAVCTMFALPMSLATCDDIDDCADACGRFDRAMISYSDDDGCKCALTATSTEARR